MSTDPIRTVCLVCGDDLAGTPTVSCPVCQAPYHEVCWLYAAGCSVYGCTGRGVVARQNPTEILGAMVEAQRMEDRGRESPVVRAGRWVDRQLAPLYLLLAGVPGELMEGGILRAVGGTLATLTLFTALVLFFIHPLAAWRLFWLGLILSMVTPAFPRPPSRNEVTELVSQFEDELPTSIQREIQPERDPARFGPFVVLGGLFGILWTAIAGSVVTGGAVGASLLSICAAGVWWYNLPSSNRQALRKGLTYATAGVAALLASLLTAIAITGLAVSPGLLLITAAGTLPVFLIPFLWVASGVVRARRIAAWWAHVQKFHEIEESHTRARIASGEGKPAGKPLPPEA